MTTWEKKIYKYLWFQIFLFKINIQYWVVNISSKLPCIRASSFKFWIKVRLLEWRNELIPVWDYISVYMKFHLDYILKRPDIFVDTSRNKIFRNKISFLPKWPQWNNTDNEFQTHMYIKGKVQILFTWKSTAGLKFHFGQNYPYESIPVWVSFCLNSSEHK